MSMSYKKLWHLLLERDMTKTDLQQQTGLSWATIAKLTNGENVNTNVLLRICVTLNCDISDISEIKSNTKKVQK